MRAILIDAKAREVREIEIDPDDTLTGLQAAVGGYIERATELLNGDDVFVDEEGLLKQYQEFFDIGAHQPFAGNGIIVSHDSEGETTSAKSTVEEIREKVRFMRAPFMWFPPSNEDEDDEDVM